MIEAVVVQPRAVGLGIGLTFAFDAVFGNKFPIKQAGAVFEQFVKRGADGDFALGAEPGEFGERIVAAAYGLVRGP